MTEATGANHWSSHLPASGMRWVWATFGAFRISCFAMVAVSRRRLMHVIVVNIVLMNNDHKGAHHKRCAVH